MVRVRVRPAGWLELDLSAGWLGLRLDLSAGWLGLALDLSAGWLGLGLDLLRVRPF